MSRSGQPKGKRQALLRSMAEAGREMSDAVVMYHSVLAEKLGLGPSDWKTLGLLERHGPQTAGELSARSGLAPASITGILDRLERGGWIQRTRDLDDGRRVVVSLDPEAAKVAAGGYFAGLMRRLDELYGRYDDEQLALLLEFVREVARRQGDAAIELRSVAG